MAGPPGEHVLHRQVDTRGGLSLRDPGDEGARVAGLPEEGRVQHHGGSLEVVGQLDGTIHLVPGVDAEDPAGHQQRRGVDRQHRLVELLHLHDGVSPILVKGSTWKEQYNELWDLLIPSTGAAKTVQGEVIRITGRVDDEINRNGGINWDRSYRNMLNSLPVHFAEGNALSEKEIEESKVLISKIDGKGLAEDGVITRLCELAVSWVILNPNPIPLGEINYNR